MGDKENRGWFTETEPVGEEIWDLDKARGAGARGAVGQGSGDGLEASGDGHPSPVLPSEGGIRAEDHPGPAPECVPGDSRSRRLPNSRGGHAKAWE